VWGAGDVATLGWDQVFQDNVPGAKSQPHQILENCSHFMQEDQGPAIASAIADFIESNPAG
jgi:haloalkane dehalogenase